MAFNLFSSGTASAQIAAIHRSQAVIEFDVTGTVLCANENFLAATGYQLAEIIGRPHALFQRKDEVDTLEALQLTVAETREVVAAAKQKNLNPRIDIADKAGDLRNICEGVNALIETLCDVVTTTADISGTLSTGSSTINQDSRNLAQRTEEQANGIEEVAKVVAHLDEMTQQSATMVEQSHAVAGTREDSAKRLQSLITSFQIPLERLSGKVDRVAFTRPARGEAEPAPTVPARLRRKVLRAINGRHDGWSKF